MIMLGYNNITIISRKTTLPGEFISCRHYTDINSAFNDQNYDAAFICTPTALHVQELINVLRHKVKLVYLEKPVSNTLQKIGQVKELAATYDNRIVVGYDLRFDPGMQQVKQLLQEDSIGKVISVSVFVGQSLPQWRPYEDHRQGMSASKEKGGGVLLDLIHEVDYLYALFGDVEDVCCHLSNSGVLEIETEESADVLLKFINGISTTVHLDYLQQQLKRFAIITGTKGTITWNLAERYVHSINRNAEETEFNYKDFDRNDRFKKIVRTFLEGKNDERFASLDDGIKSLEIVVAAKHATKNNSLVKIADVRNNHAE